MKKALPFKFIGGKSLKKCYILLGSVAYRSQNRRFGQNWTLVPSICPIMIRGFAKIRFFDEIFKIICFLRNDFYLGMHPLSAVFAGPVFLDGQAPFCSKPGGSLDSVFCLGVQHLLCSTASQVFPHFFSAGCIWACF